ncbi:MAG: heme ABC transporter ATP-binding protein [Acidiferrobacteraceae bacterium]|nr:heme ABC transporter ATP-binding protein [Acidiferrobacteraceae bacterium]|tara:strand:+ start:1534 stop:3159 length:1626 start_codon:yes stop_codon:yes gene_type:complete
MLDTLEFIALCTDMSMKNVNPTVKTSPPKDEILLQARGISKGFPGVWKNLILDNIDFDVCAGEVHALLGENGAGKTVIANILSGYYGKTTGELRVRGKLVNLQSPRDGLRHGIAMVHQELMLVPAFTVAQNVMMGLNSANFTFPLRAIEKQIDQLSTHYQLHVDPTARVEDLSAGEQQRAEILKVLFHQPNVLLLDEPTSLLTPQEADHLFRVLRSMVEEGKGIVLITHKMREVFAVADKVTVLKLGTTQGTQRIKETNAEELTRKTFGDTVPDYMERPPVQTIEMVVEVKNMLPQSVIQHKSSDGISFAISKGEILGLAGVSGNGQTELIECITGLRKVKQGQIIMLGRDMANRPPREFIDLGVAHIPERRREMGVVEPMLVAENIVLKDYRTAPFSKLTILNRNKITNHAVRIVEQFNALVPDLWMTESRILSGGNIQRLILGRETWRQPPIIVASHPTEGLDAKAIRQTWELFLELREIGSAILLVSEDLDEIMSLSDRIGVIFQGRISGIVNAKTADRAQLGHWMAGNEGNIHGYKD